LHDIDLALVMSVNPGFGGQQFIPQTLNKVIELKQMALQVNPNLFIEVDGGVGIHNIGALIEAGANVFVAGNAVFAAPSPIQMIADLKQVQTSIQHS